MFIATYSTPLLCGGSHVLTTDNNTNFSFNNVMLLDPTSHLSSHTSSRHCIVCDTHSKYSTGTSCTSTQHLWVTATITPMAKNRFPMMHISVPHHTYAILNDTHSILPSHTAILDWTTSNAKANFAIISHHTDQIQFQLPNHCAVPLSYTSII